MKAPRPYLRHGVWCLDLRSRGGGQHVPLLGEGCDPYDLGIAAASALAACVAVARVQAPELPGLSPGETLAALAADYEADRDYRSAGGRDYVQGYLGRVLRDLGSLSVADLSGRSGTAAVRAWRDRLVARGLSDRTTRNYLSSLGAVLRWGYQTHRVEALPRFPAASRVRGVAAEPSWEIATEADVRALVAGLYAGTRARIIRGEPVESYRARRALYLSVAYYTGLHTADLDRLTADDLSWEVGRYRRVNSKSARCVPPAVLDMPEQLRRDCASEVERLGRPWRPGEPVCGGPWPRAATILGEECERLSLPRITLRLLRRSCAHEYAIRGWSAERIAAVLGHVDRRMVEGVYRRADALGLVSAVPVPWSVASGPGGRPTARARVLALR